MREKALMNPSDLFVTKDNKPCYPIHIRRDFDDLPGCIRAVYPEKRPMRACIVSDSNVSALYLEAVEHRIRGLFDQTVSFVFPAGEEQKNIDTVLDLCEFLIQHRFDRQDLLIALGGGVTGDLCGFAASAFMRGIDFIQIPTSLLSQVDSSIGGKTGVDFRGFKNMIGAFYMPRLVYINVSVLQTLPEDQLLSGMGEVLKHGLIRDAGYFRELSQNRGRILAKDSQALMDAVYGSCRIKQAVTEEDPCERGIRAILNFGHTIGHAIESLSNFALPHGQCVSLGMVCALHLSVTAGGLSAGEAAGAVSVLESFGLPVVLPRTIAETLTPERIVAATRADKKRAGSRLKFVILRSVGDAFVTTDLTDADLQTACETILPKGDDR